jgi:hypothetical protein
MSKDKNEAPALVVTPSQAPVISGNFEQIKEFLQQWKKQVSSIELTEDNLEEVRLIKAEAVRYRNSLEAIGKEVKSNYFNNPKKVFDAKMDTLLSVVADVERAADEVLAKEEEERIRRVNLAIDDLVQKLESKYSLGQETLSRVVIDKRFYNKTTPAGFSSMDAFWKEGIETQFKALKKEAEERESAITLVKRACAKDKRLNEEHFLSLVGVKTVVDILDLAQCETERLDRVEKQEKVVPVEPDPCASAGENAYSNVKTETQVEAQEVVHIGIPANIDLRTDFPGKNKTLRVDITYPIDLGDSLTSIFAELSKHGIKVKKVKTKEDEVAIW